MMNKVNMSRGNVKEIDNFKKVIIILRTLCYTYIYPLHP